LKGCHLKSSSWCIKNTAPVRRSVPPEEGPAGPGEPADVPRNCKILTVAEETTFWHFTRGSPISFVIDRVLLIAPLGVEGQVIFPHFYWKTWAISETTAVCFGIPALKVKAPFEHVADALNFNHISSFETASFLGYFSLTESVAVVNHR
jgi:hypothetical protein